MSVLLSNDEFKSIIKMTNLFAIDLVFVDTHEKILLCRRNNPPAMGYWFVPGGRVRKNETLNEAFSRIVFSETSLTVDDFSSFSLIGLYDHIYEENYFSDPDFNTHYIIASFKIRLRENVRIKIDAQHDQSRFWNIEELMCESSVHRFVKSYFEKNAQNCFYRCEQ